jgi:exportin-2 (importin alpha re-exporter)
MKSYSLISEMKNSIACIAPVMTEDAIFFLNTFLSLQKESIEPIRVELYTKTMTLILKIFYSLNSQDFPEFFEDNLESWMSILRGSLEVMVNVDMRLLIKFKAAGLRALNLYCLNYYDDFTAYHDAFIPIVWNMMTFARTGIEYAKIVKQLLDYYKVLFQFNRGKSSFNSENIQFLIDGLVIPNMSMTDKELDDFEDNPINFLKIELEEIDMDSSNYVN